ncbi:MAG: dienelactone hydrolase [Planctomycetota bacterium]
MSSSFAARFSITLGLLMLNFAALVFAADGYDPLKIDTAFVPATVDFTFEDTERKRELPVRVYLPAGKQSAPVILFSHGLGGSREGSVFLGTHWASRGYVAVFLQHPGSDTSVWKDKPFAVRMTAMREAASAPNFLLRVKDVPAVLNQLELWNKTEGHALAGRLDIARVGMSGHSFGAVTTQAVSGQKYPIGTVTYTDARIKAALVLSPSAPRTGDVKQAFGDIKLPWMIMTGTNDTSPIGNATAESRLLVYDALPTGGKYELVLNKAEHSVFTERMLPGEKEPRNPNHQRSILALSTAFWDAYLRNDSAAKVWLDGDSPRGVLEKDDRWERK